MRIYFCLWLTQALLAVQHTDLAVKLHFTRQRRPEVPTAFPRWSLIGLVDPGHVTIPLCDDPEIVGRQVGYGKIDRLAFILLLGTSGQSCWLNCLDPSQDPLSVSDEKYAWPCWRVLFDINQSLNYPPSFLLFHYLQRLERSHAMLSYCL